MLPKVFVVCSGLGRIGRGFETFADEMFQVMVKSKDLDFYLFKGGGAPRSSKEKTLFNLHRNGVIAFALSRLIPRDPYWIEQVSFSFVLTYYIIRCSPNMVFTSDSGVANTLWHIRRWLNLRFKIVFSNGGPFLAPFVRVDHVQQVTPENLEDALSRGEPIHTQTLLPYGFNISPRFEPVSKEEKSKLRQKLGLPDRKIVLSVAALNNSHKRLHHLIRELAKISSEFRPYLVMLGQYESETPGVESLATELLGKNGFTLLTVKPQMMESYYRCSNAFVITSITEGFGRAVVEAMSNGLPCVVHESKNMRYLCGEYAYYIDMQEEDQLQKYIGIALEGDDDESKRHDWVYQKFSWDKLSEGYVSMFLKCV